jgi:hypothetical protein
MKRLRAINVAFGVAILVAGIIGAKGANLPLLQGPNYSDPSQILGTVNTVIQSVNTGVGGLINAQTAAVATGTGTSEQVLQTYTMPAGQLASAGQAVRISCWGTTGATANNKTRKLYFGASVITTATEAANAQNWILELVVMRTGSATQSVWGRGLAGTAGVTPISYVVQGTDDLTAGVVIKCTGTDGTSAAADITANGKLVEQIK